MRINALLTVWLLPLLFIGSASAGSRSINSLEQALTDAKAPLVLDVRTQEEFDQGHISGALLIPHNELENHLSALSGHRNIPVVVYCRSGRRAELARDILVNGGFKHVELLDGSFLDWQAAGKPVVAYQD